MRDQTDVILALKARIKILEDELAEEQARTAAAIARGNELQAVGRHAASMLVDKFMM